MKAIHQKQESKQGTGQTPVEVRDRRSATFDPGHVEACGTADGRVGRVRGFRSGGLDTGRASYSWTLLSQIDEVTVSAGPCFSHGPVSQSSSCLVLMTQSQGHTEADIHRGECPGCRF